MGYIRDYCSCKECFPTFTDNDEWGEWEVCTKCGKKIEGTYKEYNHYDGDDYIEEDFLYV